MKAIIQLSDPQFPFLLNLYVSKTDENELMQKRVKLDLFKIEVNFFKIKVNFFM